MAAGLIGIALTGLAQPMWAQEATTRSEDKTAEVMTRQGDAGLVREVRLALVCYGGSSLAIYIHGNAKELHRLVKASKALQIDALANSSAMQDYMANKDNKMKPPRGRKGQELEGSAQAWYDRLMDVWFNDKERIRTRVVVDVIAGTSAGGINGVFLAKALANDLSQDSLTKLWMEKASIRRLTDNYFRLFKVLVGGEPINGKAMAGWLYDALRNMDEQAVDRENNPSLLPLGDRLDLFVTTTDLLGYPQQVIINDPPLAAEKHFPHVLHFIYSGQNNGCGQPSGDNGIFNDFCPEWTPAMAFAARASSSIPGVFPPLHLGKTLDQFQSMPPGKPNPKAAPAASKKDVVRRLFRNHQLQQPNASNNGVDYAMDTYFVDGGVLDNHPFGAAFAEVLRRPQDQEVKRYLLYLQPDPGKPPAPPSGKKPSLVKTIKAGLSAIPAYQPILNDLNDIAEHNERVRQIRDIVHSEEVATRAFEKLERANRSSAGPSSLENLTIEERCKRLETPTVTQRLGCAAGLAPEDPGKELLQADLARLARTRETIEKEADKGVTRFAGRSYYSLRVHSVLNQFVDVIAGENVNNFPPESAHRALVARIIARWAEKRGLIDDPATPEGVAQDPNEVKKCLRRDDPERAKTGQDPIELQEKCQRDFLEDFDVGYPRRQLRFVADWVNGQYTAEVPPPQDPRKVRKALDKLKGAAADRINELTQLVGGKGTDDAFKKQVGVLRTLFGGKFSPWPEDDGKPETLKEKAEIFVSQNMDTLDNVRLDLGPVLHALQQGVRSRSFDAFQGIGDGLTDDKKLEILVRYFGFPFWDRQIYPLVAFSGLGELAEVEVVRLSPDDAQLLGGQVAKEKLVGARAAHFGAFLSREGREADYVWGRLDAAERLLTVLGLNAEERERVAGDLFHSIIEEVRKKEGPLIRESILKKREADIAQHLPPSPK